MDRTDFDQVVSLHFWCQKAPVTIPRLFIQSAKTGRHYLLLPLTHDTSVSHKEQLRIVVNMVEKCKERRRTGLDNLSCFGGHSIHAFVVQHSSISLFLHSSPYAVSLARMTFSSFANGAVHFSSKNGVGKKCAMTISFSAVTLHECKFEKWWRQFIPTLQHVRPEIRTVKGE